MMPLTFADIEEDNIIKRIGGTPEVKKHLENLGFVVGGQCLKKKTDFNYCKRAASEFFPVRLSLEYVSPW